MSLAIFALVQPFAMAQQAGENINVLPVVFPQDDPDHWFLKGDGYLQRQVEPTIAASTRNPDHLIAFFNDYRAVDIEDDVGLGETQTAALLINTARVLYATATWLPLPKIVVPPTAAAEAWVGMSRSYDGGITWSGAFLPGAPFDTASQATLDAPVFGLQAATDSVVAPGPCGKFYVVFMAFTRGDESKLVVARYQDLNNIEGGDSIVYQGMTVIESGNNATHGYFLDKPDIEVDIFREPGAEICADRVYVSYSTFNGLDKDGKFQSKISFARSIDSGETFTTQKLNPPYSQNQGSALAVDPRSGTPKTTGGGTVYMIWRHFWDPDAVLMTTSTNYGKKWSKPVVVTGTLPMAPFDQPTISTVIAPLSETPNLGFPEVAFRSNGFPTAAVTDQGKLFVAWQERVDINSPPGSGNFGRPLAGGSPRIVVVGSDDGGDTWTDVDGLSGDRRAVDMADRDVGADDPLDPNYPNLPEPGFGALPQERPSGPQVMPKLSFGGGRLMLAYYESRGRIVNYGSGTTNEWIEPEADVSPYTTFISGYDRVLDLRAALLDPLTGDLLDEGSTTQVSRYPIRAGADLTDGEDFIDVAPVNWPCSPDSGVGYPPCIRQVNRANAPQSAAGTSPFIGDYVDLAPITQFTYDGTAWRWATGAADVPYRSFHSIFADNRHLIPPAPSSGFDEWDLYPFYTTPFDSQCVNAGSRNTDVLTSKVDAELVLSAPTSYKQLDDQRGFPISISNRTGETQSYHVAITEGFDAASFVINNPAIDAGDIEIFAHSGTALMVYVETWASPPIRIRVSENEPCSSDCASGTITLNLDPENPPVAALVNQPDSQYPVVTDPFVINPFVINPFVINPFVINPFVINPFVINPFVINPFVINPFVINTPPEDIEAVIDTTWTVTGGGSNTASSYLPLINIDNAQAFLDAGYAFQLIVYKGSLYGGLDGCDAVNMAQPQILANVTQDPQDSVNNPFVINPFVINPFVINPFVINPFVINSTFTMAPSDETNPDGTTKAPPASNEVNVTLRAFKVKTTLKNGGLVYDPLQDPPSLVIVPLPCDPENPVNCDVFSLAPDLIPLGVDTTAVMADAGGTLVGFPNGGWTLLNQGYGDATAENGMLRHGFHICDTGHVDSFDTDPRTQPLAIDDPLCTVIPEFHQTTDDTLAQQADETFDPVDLSIPILPEGSYYLVLYVDDTVEVSEFNEVNNWVAVPLTIEEPNEPPTIELTLHVIPEDLVPVPSAVLVADLDGDPLTINIITGPDHGTLNTNIDGIVNTDDGTFTYTPDPNFNGTDSFTFEVTDGEDIVSGTLTIDVTPVNDAPVMGDLGVSVNEDGSVEGSLGATDVDDGDILTYSITTTPALGSLDLDGATGAFTYTPNPDEDESDSFGVEVTDGTLTAGATVTVTITAINDAPVANASSVTAYEDIEITGAVSGSDVDNDPPELIFSLVNDTQNGDLTFDESGSFTYTSSLNYNGSDSFTFRVFDGDLYSDPATVSITVLPTNDPPTAVGAAYEVDENTPLNGTLVGHDIDGDSLSFSPGTAPTGGTVAIDPATGAFTYTPNTNFIGEDAFTFEVSDGQETAAATITINVTDPVPNWDFIGFATPWRRNYKVNAGSAVPLKWYYTDPVTGDVVDSSTLPAPEPQLEIRITGYPDCDPLAVPIEVVEDPGSSDLRYVSGEWQFNWDTGGLPEGCYELGIYHPVTNQFDRHSEDGYELNIQLK